MAAENVLIFIATCFMATLAQDNGYLGSCPLGVLDVTLSSATTDSLKVLLVCGDDYSSYNVSKATQLLNDKCFRKDFRTVLYFHGFNDKTSSSGMVEAYQARGGYNILLLDASEMISIEYLRSARSVRYIGIRLGNLLVRMSKAGFNIQTLDLVGHSLGAHALGQAGKTYFKVTKKKLPRIVGLDPSGVCFRDAKKKDRIDKDDADFVQILHTNGGQLGLMSPVGHVDFYANGGRKQPGPLNVFCLLACSHERAVDLWRFSVLYPNKFVGFRCKSLKDLDAGRCEWSNRMGAIFGPTSDPKVQGIFYLKTYQNEPYFVDEHDVHYYEGCSWYYWY